MKKFLSLCLAVMACASIHASDINPLRFAGFVLEPFNCVTEETATITVAVAGGLAPYTYQIDSIANPTNEFTNIAEGSHTIRVMDAAGESISSVITTGPSSYESVFVTVEPICSARYTEAILGFAIDGALAPETSLNSTSSTAEPVGEFAPLPAGTYVLSSFDNDGPCPEQAISIEFELKIPAKSDNAIENFLNAKHCISCNSVA